MPSGGIVLQVKGGSIMSTPTEVAKQAYAAFGRGDIDAIVALVADQVDWELVGPAQLAYAGRRRTKQEVGSFFRDVMRSDDIQAFEPREFIEAGQHLTVLGWERTTALDTGITFESEWVHVFTVQNDKVTRWRAFLNTAGRYHT